MGEARHDFDSDGAVYGSLLEMTKAIPWKIDWATMEFGYIGPQIETLLGWSQDSWRTADDWASRIHPDDRQRVVDFCLSQSKAGLDHEADYRALTKDNGYVWIRDVVHVARNEKGEVDALVGFMFDISERKKAPGSALNLRSYRRLRPSTGAPSGRTWYADDSMVSEGDLLAGKYRVESVLGEGGMGYVVAALHEQLEQRVAVKLLVPELAQDQDAAARFLREARAAVRIQSEHVARVLDVGELEGGAPYMVMEFLSGRDLARELEARSTFEIGPAIDYVLQACEAVAEAHAIGVIHRDLKPANLFLTRRADGSPLVKVLDFGISKALASTSGAVSASLTAAHTLLGSPAYMSPEQARRPKDVDIRTDIWAFGVILYEFLTGDTPFHGDVPLEVITAALSDPMPSIAAVRSDVPRELEAVVAKCMEKRPSDRYQTIAEFAEALRPFAPAESMRSISRISGIIRSVAPPPPSPEAGSTTLRSAGARTPPEAPITPELEVVTRKDTPHRRDTPRRRTPGGSEPTELAHDSIQPQTRAAKDTQTDFGRSQPASHRSRRRALVVAGAAITAAVVVGWLAMHSSTDTVPPPSAASDAAARPSLAGQAEPKNQNQASVAPSAAPAMQVTPGAAIDATHPAEASDSANPGAQGTNDSGPSAASAAPRGVSGASVKTTHATTPGAPHIEPVASAVSVVSAPGAQAAKSLAPKRGAQKPDTMTPADAEDPLENRH